MTLKLLGPLMEPRHRHISYCKCNETSHWPEHPGKSWQKLKLSLHRHVPGERAKLSIKIFHAEKDITWTSGEGLRNP